MSNKKTAIAVAATVAAEATTAVAAVTETAPVTAAPKAKTAAARCAELFQTTPYSAADRGRAFRKVILTTLQQEFGATIASAASTYNAVKAKVLKTEEGKAKFQDIGRPADKNNGGPKKKTDDELAASVASLDA